MARALQRVTERERALHLGLARVAFDPFEEPETTIEAGGDRFTDERRVGGSKEDVVLVKADEVGEACAEIATVSPLPLRLPSTAAVPLPFLRSVAAGATAWVLMSEPIFMRDSQRE